MASRVDISNFCLGRKIIIVGNSSRILQDSYGSLIDNYEIVVRINRGYHNNDLYRGKIGGKTNILSLGVKSQTFATRIVGGNHIPFILCPIMYSDRLGYANAYHTPKEEYQDLKNQLNGIKPSTGIATFNFFNKLNNFHRLDLIGFDFFERHYTKHKWSVDVDFLIDDSPEKLKKFADRSVNHGKAICFKQPWNETCQDDYMCIDRLSDVCDKLFG